MSEPSEYFYNRAIAKADKIYESSQGCPFYLKKESVSVCHFYSYPNNLIQVRMTNITLIFKHTRRYYIKIMNCEEFVDFANLCKQAEESFRSYDAKYIQSFKIPNFCIHTGSFSQLKKKFPDSNGKSSIDGISSCQGAILVSLDYPNGVRIDDFELNDFVSILNMIKDEKNG